MRERWPGYKEIEKAEPYEGEDIMSYVVKNYDDIKDDDLTRGRIRSIYVKIKYGTSTPSDIAEYYNIPIKVVRDIASGKLFRKVTEDLRDEN